MGSQPLALKNLRENLFAILFNSYTETQLNELIALCHAITSASLKHIISDGSIKQEYLGLRRFDIAYNCIADLFRKDDAGNLVQFQAYFKSFSARELSDAELLAHLRRIVRRKRIKVFSGFIRKAILLWGRFSAISRFRFRSSEIFKRPSDFTRSISRRFSVIP